MPRIPKHNFLKIPEWFGVLALASALLGGCQPLRYEEARYPSGQTEHSGAFLLEEGQSVPEGLHLTWYPDGTRKSMEIVHQGCRDGYYAEWHPNGKLKLRLEYQHCLPVDEGLAWDEQGRPLDVREARVEPPFPSNSPVTVAQP